VTVEGAEPGRDVAGGRRRALRRGLVAAVAAAVAVTALVAVPHGGRRAAPARDAFDIVWATAPRGQPDAERLSGRRVDGTTTDLGPLPPYSGLDLSADGRLLAYGVPGRGVAVVTLDGFRTAVLDVPFERAPWAPSAVVWSPDGRTLAVVDGADPLEAGGVARGQDATGAATHVAYPIRTEQLAWSPDGTLLAVTPAGAGGVDVLTRAGTRVRGFGDGTLLAGHAWSPDGTGLLVGRHAGPDSWVAVVSATTGAEEARLPAARWVWRDATHVVRYDHHPHLVEDVVELDVASRRTRVLITFDAKTNPHAVAVRPAS
jgi:hypothetical protein